MKSYSGLIQTFVCRTLCFSYVADSKRTEWRRLMKSGPVTLTFPLQADKEKHNTHTNTAVNKDTVHCKYLKSLTEKHSDWFHWHDVNTVTFPISTSLQAMTITWNRKGSDTTITWNTTWSVTTGKSHTSASGFEFLLLLLLMIWYSKQSNTLNTPKQWIYQDIKKGEKQQILTLWNL